MNLKYLYLATTGLAALLATSCSQDQPEQLFEQANAKLPIQFTVTADGGSRAASLFTNGTDIHQMYVSAWLLSTDQANSLPGYDYSNNGNAAYFTNDLIARGADGVFHYSQDARYWPMNGESLDFYAVVDNTAWPGKGEFSFEATDNGSPGLEEALDQLQMDKMPDMLYATNFDVKLSKNTTSPYQSNVTLSFHHAFAKVVISAEVRNSNIRVYITDMELCGLIDHKEFKLPYKSGVGSDNIINPASWVKPGDYNCNLTGLLKWQGVSRTNPLYLDKNESGHDKLWLTGGHSAQGSPGGSSENNMAGTLLVLPHSYSGRNNSEYLAYIKLTGFAYNISNHEIGFDDECDRLIFPSGNPDKTQYPQDVTPAEMIIPVEFNWVMGTVNYYNIVFDCGNGGNIGTKPTDNPAFVRIGYEVEVFDWTTGEQRNEHLDGSGNNVDNSIEYPNKIKIK